MRFLILLCVPVCCFLGGRGEREPMPHGNTIAYMPAGSLHTALTTARGKGGFGAGHKSRSQPTAHNRPGMC